MPMVAKWMGVGFIHGVMNTDNISIAKQLIMDRALLWIITTLIKSLVT